MKFICGVKSQKSMQALLEHLADTHYYTQAGIRNSLDMVAGIERRSDAGVKRAAKA